MKVQTLFIFLFLISLASAETLTLPYNKPYNLNRFCYNNGTYCSPTTVCNMTLVAPSGKIVLNNTRMSNQFSYHNVSVPQVDELGIGGFGSMSCTDFGGNIKGNGNQDFDVDITANGDRYSAIPIQFMILILGVGLIMIGKLKEDFRLIQSLGAILTMIMGVVTLYPGYSIINYSTIQGQAVGVSAIAIGFWFMIENSFSKDKQVKTYDQSDDGRFHDND